MESPILCGQELPGSPQCRGTDTNHQSLYNRSDSRSFFDMIVTEDDQVSFVTLSRIISTAPSFSSIKKDFITKAIKVLKLRKKKHTNAAETCQAPHSPRGTDSADNATITNESFEEIAEQEAEKARQVFATNEPFENITDLEASMIKAEEQTDIYVSRKAISGFARVAEEVLESTKETLITVKDAAFDKMRFFRTIYAFRGEKWAYVPTPEEAECECYWHGDGWKFCSVRGGTKPYSPHYAEKCKELGLTLGM